MGLLNLRVRTSGHLSGCLGALMLVSLFMSQGVRAQAVFTEPNASLQKIDTGVAANLIAEIDRQLALGEIIQNRYAAIVTPPTELESITLNLFPDLTLVATRGWEGSQPDGLRSWVGKVVEDPMSFVSLVYRNGQMVGEIRAGGALYQIRHLANGVHAIKAIDQSYLNTVCNVDGSLVVTSSSDTDIIIPEKLQKTTSQEWQVDIMVLYTAAAQNDAGGENNIQMLITNSINWANQALINSRINIRLRLVQARQVNYVETRNDRTELNRLTNPSDGFMDEIHGWRDQFGADLVALYTGNGNPNSSSGIAWVPNQPIVTGIQTFANSAFSVTQGLNFPSVFTHEVGHNMGGYHDRYVEDDDEPQYSNYGYVNLEESWLTIMSYDNQCRDNNRNCQELQYFSNPNIGHPTTNTPLGIPDGQVGAADNARALNSTAQAIAGFRGQAVGAPPTLSISQNAITATLVQGATSNETIVIRNIAAAGAGALGWQVAKAPPANEPPCNWLTFTPPEAGSEPAGTAHNLVVNLSTAGLQPGTYRCNIVLTTNDPNAQTTNIPVTLNVGGVPQPRIVVTPNTHNYGNVPVQTAARKEFQVRNDGNAFLMVTSTTIAGPNPGEFSFFDLCGNVPCGQGAFALAPGATRNILVDFRPTTAGAKNANLTIVSNDPNAGIVTIALNGNGTVVAAPPDIAVNPATINVTLNQGQTTNQNLTISNTAGAGGNALNWMIVTQANNATMALLAEQQGSFLTDGIINTQASTTMDNVILTKGGPDLRQGAMIQNARGGPDAFGYTWVDSQEGDGPTFNWVDIANLGTELNLTQDGGFTPLDEGSAAVTIPFAFPFYGVNQTTMRVGANGFLTFGAVPAESWQNQGLPNAGAPNGLIAAFWDDLDGSNGGRVYSYFDQGNNRFIIQWVGFQRYQDTATNLTFQVILEPNGTITCQYQAMNGTINSASIGIENPDGSVGLQVAFNTAYAQNNRAVRFQPPQAAQTCDWLTANPANGTTNAGATSNINVGLNAANLTPGDYTCRLVITSNDPDESPVTIPVNLTVTAIAAAPDIAVNPATFNITLNQGQTSNQNLTISNTAGAGGNALTWNITTQPVNTAIALVSESAPSWSHEGKVNQQTNTANGGVILSKGGVDTRQGISASNGGGGPDAFGYTWIDSQEGGGPTYDWVEISNIGTELNFVHNGGITVLDEGFATVNLPFAFPFYGANQNTVQVVANGLLMFGTVPNETWQNQALPNGGAPNGLIAAFWDDLDGANGGRAFSFSDQANNRVIIQWEGFQRYQDAATNLSFQVILQEDGTIIYQYRSMNGTTNSASIGIENPAGAVGLQVVFNSAYVQDNLAVRFSPPQAPPPAANCDWLTVTPTNGTTNAGATSNVNVGLNTANLAQGNYSCSMTIANNDPDENPVTVTVNLTVQVQVAGPPDIAVNPAAFNVTLNQGQTSNQNLIISNTAGGGSNALTWNITTQPVTTALALVTDDTFLPVTGRTGTLTNGRAHNGVILAKGGVDTRQGISATNGGGGPDTFGYTWIDSQEGGGPTYNWVEISNIGTQLNFVHNGGQAVLDEGFATVNLPFDFPFYGANQNTVQVVVNGFLTFGTVPDETWQNGTIPDAQAPNGLIAAFWDDLDGSNAGQAYSYFDQANNRFIIQWEGFQRYQDAATNLSFQAILQPDGTIIYQYRSMTGTTNSGTIGIENPAGADGLQVVFNSAYVQDNLAVRFSPPQAPPPAANCDWLTVTPTNGTTNAGATSNVNVGLNTANLAQGNYSCSMTIANNDPDENPVTVMVNLTVQAATPPATVTDVELTGDLPEVFELGQNYPNPFNPVTEIHFALPDPGFVRLVIHNILGQKVRVLLSEMREPGRYTITWDGTNDLGQPVGNGVYLYRISAAGFSQVRKMSLLK